MIRTSIAIDDNRIPDSEVLSVFLSQAVGMHHRFEIQLRSDVSHRGLLEDRTDTYIGKPIKIGIGEKDEFSIVDSETTEIFTGIVLSVGLIRRDGETAIVVKGGSPTVAFDDGPTTRSFTDCKLNEIIDPLITGDVQKAVDAKIFKDALPYTVQYNESNFDFIKRMADRFGEWFYYDGSKVCFGLEEGEPVIPLDLGSKALISFDLEMKLIPRDFKIKSYDYEKHKYLEEESPSVKATSQRAKDVWGKVSEVFKNIPTVALETSADKDLLKNTIEKQGRAGMDEIEIIRGESYNSELKIGGVIKVSDDISGEEYGEFRITKLSHRIAQGGNYINMFTGVPKELQSPPLTASTRAPFCETQLAEVKEIKDDKSLGRVKVEFIWQRGTGEMSPLLRVASPYTGKDKGFYIIPEIGDRVLVAFEGNNPEKPYVLTGMYDGDAKPEMYDPKNNTKGFKTREKNELKFDDKGKGIVLDAPTYIDLNAGKKISLKTGGGSDSSITLDTGNGTLELKAKKIIITATESVEVTGTQKIDVGTMNYKLNADVGIEIKGLTVLVNGNAKVDVKAAGPVSVKGAVVNLNS